MRVLCLLAFSWFIGDSTGGSAKSRLMPRLPRVKLLKQVKVNDKWTLATALFDRKGRVRRDHVLINAKARVREAELTAQRNGIIPAPPDVEATLERTPLGQDSLKDLRMGR